MNRGKCRGAFDTRRFFYTYAAAAGLWGLVLFDRGQRWFGTDLPGQPFGKAALIRAGGAVIMAAACCAAGFAAIDDPRARRRGLLWFAMGHTVVWLVVLIQRIAIWGPEAEQTVQVLTTVVCTLFLVWFTADGEFPRSAARLFRGPGSSDMLGSGTPHLHDVPSPKTQYEQQIRLAAGQEERHRLARDLHDSIKQQIFVVQTAAATAQTRFDGDPAGAREALDQIRASAREAMTEMEVMLDQLRAVALENAGLIEALKKQCEALKFRTGASVEFKLGTLPASKSVTPGVHQAVLRCAQEALANVARHARATNVLVSLDAVDRRMELSIRDDGAGFDPKQDRPGMGIANMRARAEEFGGQFELTSEQGAGTLVKFSIPSTAKSPNDHVRNASLVGFVVLLWILHQVRSEWSLGILVAALAAIALISSLTAYGRRRRHSEAS